MKLSTILCGTLLLCGVNSMALAESNLSIEREQVVYRYVLDLMKADYKDITALFVEGGTVVSTSHGKTDAKEFYANFLPKIDAAMTDLHQTFISDMSNDHYAARFHFNFKYNGKNEGGEYMDEFVFAKDSAKLQEVYMFENLAF